MGQKRDIRQDEPLSSYCTLGVGGPARYLIEVHQVEELLSALAFSREKGLSHLVLGKGSNTLFDDKGFNGLVIVNKIDFFEDLGLGRFRVGAGYSFSRLGVQTARLGWGGLEFASGIPASVGGAVFMNAGANGRETAEALESVEYLDADGQMHCYSKEFLTFGYRTSSFQGRDGSIIAATFALKKEPEARGKQLKILDYRIKTQPYSEKSAGCIFRNPSPGVAAGALIEQCGLKGTAFGGAEVSSLHGNFLINKRGATAEEMKALIAKVKNEVLAKKGIALESEVRMIPYNGE